MPSIETIRRITIQQQSTGGEAVRRDLQATADAQEQIGTAAEAAAVATESAARRQLSAGPSYQRLREQLDQTARSATAYEKAMGVIGRASAQGVTSAADLARTMSLVESRYGAAVVQARAFEEATRRAAAAQRVSWQTLDSQGSRELDNIEASRKLGSIGMAPPADSNSAHGQISQAYRGQLLQDIAFQGKDFFEQVISGSSPFRAALQQGPQAIAIARMGGLGPKDIVAGFGEQLGSIADGATSLASKLGPVGIAVGAVTAALGTGAAALAAYEQQQKDLQLSVAGMGRASGTSLGQINAIAAASAGPAGLSVSAARDMAGSFASTGRIGSEMYAGLIEKARDYAVTTRQELPDATKALAEAFADPTAGAAKLNAQLGFLDAEAQETISRLDAQGNRLGAQRALFDAFAGSVEKADARLGFFSRQWQEFARNTSNEFDAIGKFVDRGLGGGDAETRLKALQGQLDFRTRNKGTAGGLFDSLLGFDEGQIRVDIAKVQAEIDQAAQRSRTSDLAQRSLAVNRLVQGANPEGEALKKAQDAATKIRTDLAAGVIDPTGDSRRTMEGFEASARRIAEDLRAGGSAMADSLRRAQFDASQVGRSGLGRTTAEIENEFAERQRQLEARNLEPSKRFEQMQSMELERVTRLQTAQREAAITETGRSGLINTVPQGLRQSFLDASAQTGTPLDFLIAVAKRESSFNVSADANRTDPRSHAYGVMQLQPGTARELGVDMYDPAQNILGGARYLRQGLDAGNNDPAAAYRYFHDGPAATSMSAAASKAFADIQRTMNMPTAAQNIAGTDTRARALDNENRLVELNSQFLGRNGAALDAATREQQLLNEAISQGRDITPALRKEFSETATAMANATRTLAGIRAGRDLEFDRDQLGRDRYDQGAFAKARSTFGDTTSPQATAYIGAARDNAMLSDARSTLTDAATGFATALSHGTSAASAFSSALSRIGDKLIGGVIDSLVGSAFKSGGGGLLSLFGFADGGMITGPGGPREDRVLARLSPGEYVVNAAATSRHFDLIHAINTGRLPGYAQGGLFTSPTPEVGEEGAYDVRVAA